MTDPDKPRRVIVTKRRVYPLADDQQGQPVEEAFLKGAKLHEVDGRKIIAQPDPNTVAD